MYVVIVTRVVKYNTGSTDKFAPRTANQTSRHACGPFRTFKSAQQAVIAAMGQHTCVDAQVWSAAQIEQQAAKHNDYYFADVLAAAKRMLAAIPAKPTRPDCTHDLMTDCKHNWLDGYCDLCGATRPTRRN